MSDPDLETTDPKRLGGDLLASARGDAPSAAARARIAGALGIGVGAAATAATTKAAAAAKAATATTSGATTIAGAGATTAAATTAKIAGVGLWTKIVGVAAVTLAVGGGAVVASRSDAPLPAASTTSFAPTNAASDSARARHNEIPPPEPVVGADHNETPDHVVTNYRHDETTASVASARITAPSARVAPNNAAADPAAPSPLAREVRAIDVARTALAGGNAPAALSALDQHDRDFPNGPMKTEADVLRVDALVASGDQAAAKRLASQLLARDPSGAHARHLRAVVAEK